MGIRRFRADYVRAAGGTGLGIVEYGGKHRKYNWELEIRAIHSIYDENRISNRDAQVMVYQFIRNRLAEDEHAILQLNKFSRRQNYHLAYKNKINVFRIEYFRGRLFHAELLAVDAISRKSSISEVFNEPTQFSIVQARKEEVD